MRRSTTYLRLRCCFGHLGGIRQRQRAHRHVENTCRKVPEAALDTRRDPRRDASANGHTNINDGAIDNGGGPTMPISIPILTSVYELEDGRRERAREVGRGREVGEGRYARAVCYKGKRAASLRWLAPFCGWERGADVSLRSTKHLPVK